MIDPAYYGLVELILVGGIAIGLGVWQLWSVNRDQKRDRDKRD
jgi:hypothetical protein